MTPPEPPTLFEDIAAWLSCRDEAAARRLMAALHPRVAGIIRRHWTRQEEWEDLEQEVFLRVFEALPRYRPDGAPLEHWVSRITLKLILSLLHLEGKPLEEIARLTGLSRVVVKVRAFRARKKLHAALRRLEGKNPVSSLTGRTPDGD